MEVSDGEEAELILVFILFIYRRRRWRLIGPWDRQSVLVGKQKKKKKKKMSERAFCKRPNLFGGGGRRRKIGNYSCRRGGIYAFHLEPD